MCLYMYVYTFAEGSESKMTWYHVTEKGKTLEKESSDGILDVMNVNASQNTGLYKCVATDSEDKTLGIYTVALIVSYRAGSTVLLWTFVLFLYRW